MQKKFKPMGSDSHLEHQIESFRRLLENGRDSALLRFSLGSLLLQNGQAHEALEHLELAVHKDPNYTAAYKLLAKSLAETGETARAIAAYETGINVARNTGDKQVEKEMSVFLKRLKKFQ